MSTLPSRLIDFAVKLAALVVKPLGDVPGAALNVASEDLSERIKDRIKQGPDAEKLLEAFNDADACFAQQCGDDTLKQAIISKPLHALPSLEKLAAALPDTLDDASLRKAIRTTFESDWRNQLTDAQLNHAASIYLECLSRPLAAKCGQIQEQILFDVKQIKQDVRDIKSLLIDTSTISQLGPRAWLRPSAPRPDRVLVGRVAEMDALRALLQPGGHVAITATVHGTPGVGKTLLAQQLAIELDGQFAGGVLFQFVGSSHRDAELCKPILNNWASYAYNGQPLPEGTQLAPDAVRHLLDEREYLLVVLDDVWDTNAIKPLRDALPNDACVLITTRNTRIARELGEAYELDVLSPQDALALLRRRVRNTRDDDVPLLKQLADALGRHAQALDIAAGSLDRRNRNQWPDAVAEMARQVREGSGFGELHLPGDEERENKVEAALKFSYDDLSQEAQRRFRTLGAFAADASFLSFATAAMWECQPDAAESQLNAFRERGLLSYLEEIGRWQQHSLLRAYALALARRENEEDTQHERHAAVYLALIRDADDRQVYYRMLPDYPQLRHAFEWAIEHNIALAQSLAANTANLQAAFNLVRDNYDWASRLVVATRDSADESIKAQALLTFGNALYRIAALPGEDRRQRLLAALEAYDDALIHYRPEVAPLDYAATQNNRGIILSEIAALPGEDRRQRLLAALAAYDEALLYRRPEVAPLAYAMTQNNRGDVLLSIADLPGEDRRTHLFAALEALKNALQYRRPEVAPLQHAISQNTHGNVLANIAALPSEDRHARLRDAIKCAWIAYSLFQQLEHEPRMQEAAGDLQRIAQQSGLLFPALWAELTDELDLGDPPAWLLPPQPAS